MFETLDTLSLLKQGLPEKKLSKDIIIVGAGIAGLVAARILSQAGHNIKIIEAKSRPGGRIFTKRLHDGRFVELGAMRFSKKHTHAMELISQLGLKLSPFHLRKKQIYIGGRLYKMNDFLPGSVGFKVYRNEDIPPPLLLNNIMKPIFSLYNRKDQDETEAWFEMLHRYDRFSILDWFKECKLSDAAIAVLSLYNNIEGRLGFNFAEWSEYIRQDAFGDDLTYIKQGADTIIEKLVQPFNDRIKYGCKLVEVKQSLTHGIIKYTTAFGKVVSMKADEVILTIPPIVLRHIPIEGFDLEKLSALRATYQGRGAKVFLQFNKRWWDDLGFGVDGGLVVTDLPARNIIFTPAGQGRDKTRGLILGSYTWEADSMVLSNLPEAEKIERVLYDVIKIFPEAEGSFERGYTHDWGTDRWAGGIGGLFQPHEMTGQHYRNLLRPVGRVWLSGDTYTRRYRRWIEGAIRSAIKISYAVHMDIRGEKLWLD